MKLKYKPNRKLWIPGLGIHEPGETIEMNDDQKARKMIDSGYFREVKEQKLEKKGVDKS